MPGEFLLDTSRAKTRSPPPHQAVDETYIGQVSSPPELIKQRFELACLLRVTRKLAPEFDPAMLALRQKLQGARA